MLEKSHFIRVQTNRPPGSVDCVVLCSTSLVPQLGLIDNWLRHVQDVRAKHRSQIDSLATEQEQHARLCELNVIEQVANVRQTTIVRDAWSRDQTLVVHGWIYDLSDGLLRDLEVSVNSQKGI